MTEPKMTTVSKYFEASNCAGNKQFSLQNEGENNHICSTMPQRRTRPMTRLNRRRRATKEITEHECAKKQYFVDDELDSSKDREKEQIVMHVSVPSKLKEIDFNKSGIALAKNLLGKIITRKLDDGEILSGRIVETEAYLGEIDRACHTYGGKRTERTEAMYMRPGTLYVYFIYGMYYCLNISSQDEGGCVLIRALEPIRGKDTMRKLRCAKSKSGKSIMKDSALCNGPSKLCTALAITKENVNKECLVDSDGIWIEKDDNISHKFEIVVSKRIGIDSYGKEWASKPFRFYILGNSCISIKDKEAEASH